jgi:hypothetical protein
VPRRNRVDPFGGIVAVSDKGDLMGNRGCLHDDGGEIVRRWKSRIWISCITDYPGAARRPLAAPEQYTVLFFRDEATALAAGHRPCAQCRRAAYNDFLRAWCAAHGGEARATVVDARLHPERTGDAAHVYAGAPLPNGAMIGTAEGEAWLAWEGRWRRWSFAGYDEARREPSAAANRLLTPPSIVAALRAGYRPQVHETAR